MCSMPVRLTIFHLSLVIALAGSTGCGKMVLVGEVDGGQGTDLDSDTDVDSDTDIDTDTDADSCNWHTFQFVEGLYAVWGASVDAVYAVGGWLPYSPAAVRYDGSSWVELGGLPGSPPGLSAVWGSASDDVWAVSYDARVMHFDGSSWESAYIANDPLFGIWGSSEIDVFAVGGGIFQYAMVMHYTGESWLPMSGAAGGWLNAVWGSASDDVYAVGREAINHFNGYLWSEVDLGEISLAGVTLEDVWGSSGSDVYAAGYHWAGPVLLHYDGVQWQGVNVGSIASGAELFGVHGVGPDNVWAVGGDQSGGIVLRNDGSGWEEIGYPFPFTLYDVWVASTGEVFTVGDLGAVYCTLE
jgi:hypothetical protein